MSDNAAVDRLNALVSKLVAAIRPPPNVTVSEWAAQNRVLSPEASAEQGRWRNSRTPYLVEIMDAYSDPRVHHIVVVASSQVGKSEFENNVIGRTIDVDPGSILFIHPVQTDAKEYSKLRIAPMIRDCPTLRAKVAESKSRDSGNTILQKSYPGGILTMCGSTEAHALAYTESELLAALVQSYFTAWIVSDAPKDAIPFNETGSGDLGGVPVENPQMDNASHSTNEYEMGPGQVEHLAKGEDIKFGNPNIPTAGFEQFVKTLCKLMGGAIEMPYELLLKEFNASYSASRAALLEAWEGFKMRRTWLVDSFCQPAYEIWLSEAVARGRVIAPGFFDDPLLRAAWCGARWIGPVQGSLDPAKEVNAAILQTHHAFKTHEQVTLEMGGGDWTENAEQLARENELLKAAGSEGAIETTASITTQGGKQNAQTE